MTVVSTTDYWEAKRLGPLGMVAVAKLRAAATEAELAKRRRRLEELSRSRITGGPTPGSVQGIRDSQRARRKVVPVPTSRPSSTRAEGVDFRPDRERRFAITLTSDARDSIRRQLHAASPLDVETGGYLFSHHRPRLDWVEITIATGPAPNSRHGRTSVILGKVADVEAEFGEFTRRAELKHIGCWHSHPFGDGRPSPDDLNVWSRRLEETGWFRYLAVIATPRRRGARLEFPRIHPWLVSRESATGQYVCEGARIREI